MRCGPLKPRAVGSWKAATARLIEAAGGTQAAADITRVGKTQLQRYTDPAEPAYAMPVDVVVALETVVGQPIVTAHLAARSGHCLWRPPEDQDGPESIHRHYAEIGRAVAEVMAEYALAIADGVIEPREAERMLATIDPATAALMHVRAQLYERARPDDAS